LDASGVKIAELVRLQKFAQRITASLDLDEIVQRVADEVAAALGCVEINVYLHDPVNNELVLSGMQGCSVHGKGHRLKVGTEGMVGYVAATRQMRYAPNVARDPYYKACEADVQSEVAIPLHVENELIGVFTASHCEPDAFSEAHLRLLQGFCSHVAVAVQNARRFHDERHQREAMSREADEARSIQQALLPRSSPFIPGFRVSGLSIPAGAIGGDWYDFIPLENGRWGLVLADVSGKGTAAALLMSATRGMLRSLAQTGSGPAEVLTRLNKLMVEDFPCGRFVTMVYAGYINKNIVAGLQALNCNAIGLCGVDGNAILAHKRSVGAKDDRAGDPYMAPDADHKAAGIRKDLDYGFVGDIDAINKAFLDQLLREGKALVFAPITHDGKGQLLNTNADTIAKEIAVALSGSFGVSLVYSFEKSGVLLNAEDDRSVIRRINAVYYKELRERQVVFGGMIPKLDNAFAALGGGVKKVIIGRAEDLPELLAGRSGTTIVHA